MAAVNSSMSGCDFTMQIHIITTDSPIGHLLHLDFPWLKLTVGSTGLSLIAFSFAMLSICNSFIPLARACSAPFLVCGCTQGQV